MKYKTTAHIADGGFLHESCMKIDSTLILKSFLWCLSYTLTCPFINTGNSQSLSDTSPAEALAL
jgi:hypothetical protein